MTTFADKISTRKGELGEQFGDHFLRSVGYQAYKPGGNGAHPFDRLYVRRGDRSLFIGDTKSKPARVKFPDTGIDMRHRDEYLGMSKQHGLECLLVFVDEDAGRVYGGFLEALERHRIVQVPNGNEYKARKVDYPKTEWTVHSNVLAEIRYYPLIAMRPFGDLSAQQCEELRALSTRADPYRAAAEQKANQWKLL